MKQIVIIKLGAIGDVVRTTAILPPLRKKYDNCNIIWVTSKASFDIVNGNPLIDLVLDIDSVDQINLLDMNIDWVISLDDERNPCSLASRLKAKKISGAFLDQDGDIVYSDDFEDWFGMGILRPDAKGGIDQANILKKENRRSHPEIFYKCLHLDPPYELPGLPIRDNDRLRAKEWLSKNGFEPSKKLIGLNTGAGKRWPLKSLGIDHTVELAKLMLQRNDCNILILGGADEHSRNQEIFKLLHDSRGLCGPTNWPLMSFAALVAECDLLISSDSLALHLAVAEKVPVVAFFGPTSFYEIYLYENGSKIQTPLECHCCYLKKCDISPSCMEMISPKDLFNVASSVIDSKS